MARVSPALDSSTAGEVSVSQPFDTWLTHRHPAMGLHCSRCPNTRGLQWLSFLALLLTGCSSPIFLSLSVGLLWCRAQIPTVGQHLLLSPLQRPLSIPFCLGKILSILLCAQGKMGAVVLQLFNWFQLPCFLNGSSPLSGGMEGGSRSRRFVTDPFLSCSERRERCCTHKHSPAL